MVSKSQLKATEKFNKKKYDEIKIRVYKGLKNIIVLYAENNNQSVNNYINNAILYQLEKDGYNPEEQTAGRGAEPEKMP